MLILLVVALLFSGCGSWFVVPYSFQPSYWEFKKMCEINYMPNTQEKYNIILKYIDKSLGDVDDFLQSFESKKYFKCKLQEDGITGISNRITSVCVNIYYNDDFIDSKSDKILTFDKIKDMYLEVNWQSYEAVLDGNEGAGNFGIVFDKNLYCSYFYRKDNIPSNFFTDRLK